MAERKTPFPTLLSKTDAMMHAAGLLERMVTDLTLLDVMKQVLEESEVAEKVENKDVLESLRVAATGIVDFELQRRAMADAAAEIRAHAQELKLVEARVARDGIKAGAP